VFQIKVDKQVFGDRIIVGLQAIEQSNTYTVWPPVLNFENNLVQDATNYVVTSLEGAEQYCPQAMCFNSIFDKKCSTN